MSLIHLPEEELKKLAKMSMPRLLYELRKRNIDHAIVANPDNPKRQIIWKAKDHRKENLLWFWRNYRKAILVIIYTMEDCQVLRFSKALIGPRKYE